MCGIAGIFHAGADKDSEFSCSDALALRRMTRMLTHRGPDEEGYHEEAGIGLGHRRLSIIDLSTGQQPLCNEDGTIWVAFNGEIFNYIELREELSKRGHRFRTHSDTETLVHAYEEYGYGFVERLNGQFAIALWDRPRRRLVLVRDRVGIRPLFHATLPDGTLLFGSEMKALFAQGTLKPDFDPIALGQISLLWVSVPPRTPFRGIEELGPGRMMVCEADGSRRIYQYWRHQFPDAGDYEMRSFDAWKQDVRETLYDAVTLQLRSDVPVATFLSGGLDSSIISALVKRFHINNLITFSVAFKDARFDERAFQNLMAKHLGTDHRTIEVGPSEIGSAFAEVIWFAERPMMRTAPAPLLSLAGLVRESGIKVVLTGEGADEVFGGYDIFKEDKVRRFWARNPDSAWRSLLLSKLYGDVKRDPRAEAFFRAFFRKGLTEINDPYYSHRLRWSNTSYLRRYLHPDLRAQLPSEAEVIEEVAAYLDPDRDRWHPLCRAQYLEFVLFMSNYLLNSQGDRVMMGRSVEGRVPFLDHRVIELGARIPPKYKVNGTEEKYLLKRAFDDILPADISRRPKKPYRAPIAECLAPGTPSGAMLRGDSLTGSGLLNANGITKLLAKAESEGKVSERDEMALAVAASLQLLHLYFIRDFESHILKD